MNKQKVIQPNVKIINLMSCILTGHHHHWHLPCTQTWDRGVVWTTCLHHNPPLYPNMNRRISWLPSPSSHPNTTCHFNSSPPPPLSLPTVRWRGIQKTVRMVYRVDEQCGVAGALRCVNFICFLFFLFTHPPTPNILQMRVRIFISHLHPHPLCLSLPKTSRRVLHHWPSPSHCSHPSPLNKRQDNTVNAEHRCEHT